MSKWTKSEARAELQERKYGDSSVAIERLVSFLQQNSSIRSVLTYKPVAKWHEVDITSLPGLLPNVQFDFVENTKDAPFPTKKYDAVIVPLFGFNEEGYRLGHGGGWYDRFLATQPQAIKIGVGYENSLIDFKSESHDIRIDIVITEEKTRDSR